MKVIYKITYPNGKIYVGKDLTEASTILAVLIADLSRKTFHASNGETSQSEEKYFGNQKQQATVKSMLKKLNLLKLFDRTIQTSVTIDGRNDKFTPHPAGSRLPLVS